MTSLATVSIDRTGLSLSALVIETSGAGTYVMDQGGLGRVGTTPRDTLATDSPFIHGHTRVASVLEETTLPLVVRVQSTTSALLNTAVTALETALHQFVYTVTVTVDGIARVWTAYPATIGAVDGLVAYERVTDFYEVLSISIPVYPVSA